MSRYRPPGPKSSLYITQLGFDRLKAELHQLWKIERPQVTQAVADAAALGDRSENAEYIYGKKRLREIDRRVRYLSKRLESLKVVNQPPENLEKVYFGAWVRIEELETEAIWCVRIVGPDEFDLDPNYISLDSPVARQLIGKPLGEELWLRRPKGNIEVLIDAIHYQTKPDWPELKT